MTAHSLFVEVKADLLSDGHLPTLPYMLRFEADDPDLGRLLVDPIYREAPRLGYQPFAGARWTCDINDGDGRIGKIVYRDDRESPRPPYDEFLATLVSVTLFAEGLAPDDRRQIGLLICAKTLLRFWRDDADRLRAAARTPFGTALV